MYSVSPKNIERFCLRLLLLHVPGATSFEDLRKVNGETYATFKETCQVLHLLADDTEWDNALAEAATFQMPSQLRSLFAIICNQCEPQNPLELWLNHKDLMIEDYILIGQLPIEQAESRALQDIQAILLQAGTTCAALGLPDVQDIDVLQTDFDLAQEEEVATANMRLLNTEQLALVEAVIAAASEIAQTDQPKCHAYFLDGPGGSGKTMMYNTLISYFRAHHMPVAASAWTGIAATLLKGGRTVHSLFKLPVPILETSTCNVTPTSIQAKLLRSITMFIIDEASMVPLHALGAIDKMLQDITGNKVPFGGKIFLLGGDFRQVLPVLPKRPPTVFIENCWQ
jgi:hypothetical protein